MKYSKQYTTKDDKLVLVRNAVTSDAEAVTNISNKNYVNSPFLSRGPEDPGDSIDGTASYIEDLLPAEREAFLVAVIDDQIVGFAHLDGCGTRRKMLHRSEVALGVDIAFRNQGVGHCLMKALLTLAQEAAYEQVELTVIEDNVLGVSLYKSCGFETTGKLPHAYKYGDGSYGDFLQMVCKIEA